MNRSLRPLAVEGMRGLGIGTILFGLLIALLLVPVLLFLEAGPAGILALPVGTILSVVAVSGVGVALLAYDDRLWVYSAILSLAVFIFRQEEGALGADVIFFAAYTVLGTLAWVVKEIVLGETHLVRSRFDVFFVSTILLCIITTMIAGVVHGAEFRFMIREYLSFLLLLFYFPVRSLVSRRREVPRLFATMVFLGLMSGVVNLMTYQEKVVASALAFGEVNARSAMNEPLSAVLFCCCFALVVGARKFWTRLLALGGLSIFGGLLVLSLSRGPIVATAVGTLTVLFLLYRRRALRVLLYALVALVVNVGAAFLLLPDFAESIFANIEGRFQTVERLGSDVSFGSRFAESKSLYTEFIPASPLIGYGFGVPYTFYDPVFEVTSRPYYTHNGYLHALFKFGVPLGVLLLLLVLLSPLLRYPYAGVRRLDRNSRLILAGALASQIALVLINVTSNVMTYYTELLLLAILLALFDQLYVGKYQREGDRAAALSGERLS